MDAHPAMRALGARVVLAGDDFDAAKEAARRWAADVGHRMVEDGRDPEISEGAGTIAIELLARQPDIDAVVVPVGNGALLAGMARWLKAAAPAIRVLGACSRGAPAMEHSWRAGTVIHHPRTNTIAVCEAMTTKLLLPGECETVSCMGMILGGGNVFVDVDPEDTIADCHPGNNLGADALGICPG